MNSNSKEDPEGEMKHLFYDKKATNVVQDIDENEEEDFDEEAKVKDGRRKPGSALELDQRYEYEEIKDNFMNGADVDEDPIPEKEKSMKVSMTDKLAFGRSIEHEDSMSELTKVPNKRTIE